jgi:hypothetical protein
VGFLRNSLSGRFQSAAEGTLGPYPWPEGIVTIKKSEKIKLERLKQNK